MSAAASVAPPIRRRLGTCTGDGIPAAVSNARPYTRGMPKRDPHEVLGLKPGAAATAIRAAWRKLAREHHPDLASKDPAAVRAATRQMAETNAAYNALHSNGHLVGPARGRPAGPPEPKPSPPVTGRVDTSSTFRARNATTGPQPRHAGQAPPGPERVDREPPRASTPTGPLRRGRLRRFRPPAAPPLDVAQSTVIEFGKFHGHTLGEIAGFEPSYIDWLARTIARDPELVAAAKAVQDDLDRRSVPRRAHPEPASRSLNGARPAGAH